jgi:hypothetical protein
MKTRNLTNLFLSTLMLASLASCSTKVETNYFEPTVDSKYESINKEEFMKKFNESMTNDIGYDYVSANVSFAKPYDYRGVNISEFYMAGKINQDAMKSGSDLRNSWVASSASSVSAPLSETTFTYSASIFRTAYNFDNAKNFTASPYSYEIPSFNTTIKYVYSNDFLLKSISYVLNNHSINIDVKYFNEVDLPSKKGEISKETFFNMAFVSNFKPMDISTADIEYIGKNVIVDSEEVYDPSTDFYVTNYVTGNVKMNLKTEIDKTLLNNAGKVGCYWIVKNTEVLQGEIDNKWKNDIVSNIGSHTGIPKCSFSSNLIDESMLDYLYGKDYVVKYSNSPLAVSIKSSKKDVYIEFSNNGFISNYKEKDKEKNSEFEVFYRYQ